MLFPGTYYIKCYFQVLTVKKFPVRRVYWIQSAWFSIKRNYIRNICCRLFYWIPRYCCFSYLIASLLLCIPDLRGGILGSTANRLLPLYVVVGPRTPGMVVRLRGGCPRISGSSAAFFGSLRDHPFPPPSLSSSLPSLSGLPPPPVFSNRARPGKPELAPFAALLLPPLFSLSFLPLPCPSCWSASCCCSLGFTRTRDLISSGPATLNALATDRPPWCDHHCPTQSRQTSLFGHLLSLHFSPLAHR